MASKKRTVKKAKKQENKRYIGRKIENLLVAASMVIGTIAGTKVITSISDNAHSQASNKTQIGIAKDNGDDEYENEIPIYNKEGKLIGTLCDNSVVIVGSKIKDSEGMYEISGVSETGELISGETYEDYFDVDNSISMEDLEEYTKHIYEVVGTDVVNIRESTIISNDSKIGIVNEGEYLFGGEKVVSKDNDFMWVPILYEKEYGSIAKAYICYDYVKDIDEEAKTTKKRENERTREKGGRHV